MMGSGSEIIDLKSYLGFCMHSDFLLIHSPGDHLKWVGALTRPELSVSAAHRQSHAVVTPTNGITYCFPEAQQLRYVLHPLRHKQVLRHPCPVLALRAGFARDCLLVQ